MFDEGRDALFVAASRTILAFGPNRRLIWRRDSLREFDARFQSCANGILSVDVEEELGGERKILHFSVNGGAFLSSTEHTAEMAIAVIWERTHPIEFCSERASKRTNMRSS